MLALKVLRHMAALSLMHIGTAEQQPALLETRSLQKSSRTSHSVVLVVVLRDNPHLLSRSFRKLPKGGMKSTSKTTRFAFPYSIPCPWGLKTFSLLTPVDSMAMLKIW